MARGSEHYYPSTSTLMDAPELLPDLDSQASDANELEARTALSAPPSGQVELPEALPEAPVEAARSDASHASSVDEEALREAATLALMDRPQVPVEREAEEVVEAEAEAVASEGPAMLEEGARVVNVSRA